MSLISKIMLLCATMTMSVVTLTCIIFFNQAEFSGAANELYDNGFVGVHYAHKVEVKFVRFETSHEGHPPPYRAQADIDALNDILNDLDVAAERAPGARPRKLALAARADIVALMDPRAGDPTPQTLLQVDRKLTRLVQSYADAALDMRTAVDERVAWYRPRLSLIVGLVLLFGVGGAVLLVINVAPPLRKIARLIDADEGVGAFGDGRLLKRKDEIGAVARAIERGRAKLKESIILLEARVLQRTAELESAKDEAEAANLAKTSFLANVSHEIRTPLNGVLGMAQAMDQDALAPHQKERLAIIRQSGEALLLILNDILDLSKIEAGKLELEAIAFDLEGLVAGVQAPFSQLATSQDLRFSMNAADVSGVYRGDPVRIRQILYNLISNALKFTEAGGVKVTILSWGAGVRIVVEDSGIGMSPEVLDRLFSTFTQADASTTRRFGGTGLGLAICRQLVELMDGRIEAESQVGVGSRFIVDLPITRIADASTSTTPDGGGDAGPAPCDPEATSLRLLAAEDNSVNQLVLKTLLDQAGIHSTIVDNGQKAVEAWRTGDFDLILMDIQMPVMDGQTATRAIRALEAATGRARTPIIAVTANVMAHQIELYRAMGMDGHIAKPLDLGELFAVLSQQLKSRGRDEAAA